MKNPNLGRFIAAAYAVLYAALIPVHKAAAADDLVVGQVVPLTSQIYAAVAQDYVVGAQAYFSSINAKGGINGRQIRLVVKDDAFTPEKTLQATRELLQDNAIALYGYIGTPQIQSLVKNKVLADAGIALVAPWSGAPELREPNNPNLFHIRASSAGEGAKMVAQLYTLGMRRFAVMHMDNTFGRAGLAGTQAAMSHLNMKAVAVGIYPPSNPEDVDAAVAVIASANPEAVILIVGGATGSFVKKFRAAGSRARLFAMSSVNFKDLVSDLGSGMARGIGIAQVMPFPYTASTPIAREFREVMSKYNPDKNISHTSMESFVAAKVLVEAIRRAGSNPSRQKIVTALDKMNSYDLGGFKVGFSPDNHQGSTFVEITVIGPEGKLMR